MRSHSFAGEKIAGAHFTTYFRNGWTVLRAGEWIYEKGDEARGTRRRAQRGGSDQEVNEHGSDCWLSLVIRRELSCTLFSPNETLSSPHGRFESCVRKIAGNIEYRAMIDCVDSRVSSRGVQRVVC